MEELIPNRILEWLCTPELFLKICNAAKLRFAGTTLFFFQRWAKWLVNLGFHCKNDKTGLIPCNCKNVCLRRSVTPRKFDFPFGDCH